MAGKWKTAKLNKECKAAMTLLVREVQDCKTKDELNMLLKSWIEANDLHPEAVVVVDEASIGFILDDKGIRR